MASVKKQTAPSPTTTAPATQSADQYAASNPIPSGGNTTTNVANAPAPIGVGYQVNDTGGDIAVFEDGSVQAVQRGQTPSATDDTGKPLKFLVIHPGQVVTDTNGVPMPYVAQRNIPGVAGVTSRIQPGSQVATNAAQQGYTQQVPAQYREGDEYRLAGNLPPEQRAQIQQAMLDRGLFGSAKPRTALGGWDAESASAFKQLLAYANSTGQDYETALQNMPKLTDAQINGVSAKPVISLSHPDDLAAVFKNAASNLIGSTNVPQSMIDGFVRSYQDMERKDQEAANAAQQAATTTTPTVPPGTDITGALPDSAAGASGYPGGDTNPTTTQTETAAQYAQDYLRKNMGGQVRATDIARVGDMFMNFLNNGLTSHSTQGASA